ncbi:MAG: hypothetical protein QOJ91_397 [Sphingomonadales bacterium]|jgi:uncharacterized membrane protein YgdD (TMEM256/DUF423 family)|nr:hypothetical protein [Sphingomonadales bacterium]
MNRPVALAGAAMAGIGVGLGAFGAHALKTVLSAEALGWWQTAVQYQMWHAIALVALGTGTFARPTVPALLLGGGASIFAATLYAMALGAPHWLGAVTPIGGALMIAGWICLAFRLIGPGEPEPR